MLLPKRLMSLAAVVVFIIVFLCLAKPSAVNSGAWAKMAHYHAPAQPIVPLITHIVLFQFKSSASHTEIKELTARMLALKKTCIHPTTAKPYIVSITGGKDISIEQQQNDMTHGFVVQFSTPEDRDYYVNKDPAHAAFKQEAAELLQKSQVIDFKEGSFI